MVNAEKKSKEAADPGGAATARGRPRAFDRDAALMKAMKLFWVKGYEATSITDLTAALGVGPTSLYAAFGPKDQLYAQALALYSTSYQHLVLGKFHLAPTAREAAMAYLCDSASAMTGSDSDLPHGCMVTLGAVGADEHRELADLMRVTRGGAYDVLLARLERAVHEGELAPSVDITHLARFLQTVQSGMAIRARDGASREELQAVARVAMASWDGVVKGLCQR